MVTHAGEFSITPRCRVLEVSASGYYQWRSRPNSLRAQEIERLVGKIRAIHLKNHNLFCTPHVSSKTVQHSGCTMPEYVKTVVKLLLLYPGLVHRRIWQETTTLDKF
jgi:hypothetical protein